MESVTDSVEFQVSKVENRVIMVVDVPGVCDTGDDHDAGLTSMLEKAIAAHPRGYHALLLVYKYGERFTKEGEETVAFLKEKLGNDFIKKHAIANGDTFEREGNSKYDFEAWCREQTGPFRQLFEECNYRSVLFNNQTEDKTIVNAQRKALLDIIDTKLQGTRYDHESFKLAQAIETSLMKEPGNSLLTEEIINDCSLIVQRVEEFLDKPEQERDIEQLTDLLGDTTCLQEKVKEKEDRTKSLAEVFELSKLFQKIIKEEQNKKKSKSKKMKGASIGELVKNIHSSGSDKSNRMAMRQSFKQIKSDYHNNVTEKLIQKIHGQF